MSRSWSYINLLDVRRIHMHVRTFNSYTEKTHLSLYWRKEKYIKPHYVPLRITWWISLCSCKVTELSAQCIKWEDSIGCLFPSTVHMILKGRAVGAEEATPTGMHIENVLVAWWLTPSYCSRQPSQLISVWPHSLLLCDNNVDSYFVPHTLLSENTQLIR